MLYGGWRTLRWDRWVDLPRVGRSRQQLTVKDTLEEDHFQGPVHGERLLSGGTLKKRRFMGPGDGGRTVTRIGFSWPNLDSNFLGETGTSLESLKVGAEKVLPLKIRVVVVRGILLHARDSE